MHLNTSRLAGMLAAIRASPLTLHLARAPVRAAAARLRPVSMALIGPPRALNFGAPTHDPTLAIADIYDAHLRMCGLLEAFADLRGDCAA